MFKLICFALLISYSLSAPTDEESIKVDDFDDDWGLDDIKPDSKDSESEQDINKSQPDEPKGPISYIQKIPRRGEKPSTQTPVEIIPQDPEDNSEPKRERRDTLSREQKKEQRRLNKKNNKQAKDAVGAETLHHHSPDHNPDHILEDGQTITKRPRKQKGHKQGKSKINDDSLPPVQGSKKQRQGGKKNKEGKKDKIRPERPAQRQGKNGQRPRKQKPSKHQPTETTLQ